LGLGKALVEAAIRHYAGVVPVMRVGTQITNEASMAIYAAKGFTKTNEMVTFHWTPPGPPAAANEDFR
jgi:ribosomal protein S18 acetylase RimI-like enzyme